jgi:hypothetical protein
LAVFLEIILEIDMKKLVTTALILVLTGFQAVTEAQPSKTSPLLDMKAMHDEMQEKVASAKTDAECQQSMVEKHKNAQTLHGQMHGMPWAGAEHQKRMQSMHDQMSH